MRGKLSMICWNVCGWSRRDDGEMSLMKVDDAVLFCEDEEGMRVSWGVKCGVMHVRRKGVKRMGENFYVDSKRIEVVKEYKYLSNLECVQLAIGVGLPSSIPKKTFLYRTLTDAYMVYMILYFCFLHMHVFV